MELTPEEELMLQQMRARQMRSGPTPSGVQSGQGGSVSGGSQQMDPEMAMNAMKIYNKVSGGGGGGTTGGATGGGIASYAAPVAAMAGFMKGAKDSGLMDTNMEVLQDNTQWTKDLGNRTKDLAAKMKFWEWF